MTAREDQDAYTRWIHDKAIRLRRPKLDCGCPTGGATAGHIWCNRIACLAHADDAHDCSAFGGLKDGIEEGAEPPEAVPAVPVVPSGASPGVSFADVAAGPVAGVDAAVDVRRRVQDGTAPTPDPVGDVLRAEALRQGLTECELDGVHFMYVDGAWFEDLTRVEALRPTGGTFMTEEQFDRYIETGIDPAAPPVDELLEPASVERYDCPVERLFDTPCPVCSPEPKPRPWWLRWLPGGRR